MCLIAFALNAHPDWPLVIWANRDEFHERPAAAAHWWQDETGAAVFGGRDLQAGGTWMASNRRGDIVALTNIRQPGAPAGLRSRGHLVTHALRLAGPIDTASLGDWAGFNLLRFRRCDAPSTESIWVADYLSSEGECETLQDGVHGLSNAKLNSDWPKLQQLKSVLTGHLSTTGADALSMAGLTALSDRRIWPDEALPKTGVPIEWERMLSACHIVSPGYGTRCSTVVMVDRMGRQHWTENRFDPEGQSIGRQDIRPFDFSPAQP